MESKKTRREFFQTRIKTSMGLSFLLSRTELKSK
jgi:hypothetical protein